MKNAARPSDFLADDNERVKEVPTVRPAIPRFFAMLKEIGVEV